MFNQLFEQKIRNFFCKIFTIIVLVLFTYLDWKTGWEESIVPALSLEPVQHSSRGWNGNKQYAGILQSYLEFIVWVQSKCLAHSGPFCQTRCWCKFDFFLIQLARIWLIIQAESREPRMQNKELNIIIILFFAFNWISREKSEL